MKLKHESGGRQIDVLPDMAPMYESQGWRKVVAASKPQDKPKSGEKK